MLLPAAPSEPSPKRGMRVAFITPTLHSLGQRWQADPQIVKLGAPTIAGFLHARGYSDLRQYDFEVEVFELESRDPGRLNLEAFFDDEAVDRFLTGDDETIRDQAELIVDALGVEEADIFAFSCSSVLEIYADMHAAGNINLCLCKVLKERFPKCKTVVGGLQMSPDELHRAEYEKMLGRSADLDFAVEGKGEAGMLHVLEHLTGERSLEDNGREYRAIGHGLLLGRTYQRQMHVPKSFRKESENGGNGRAKHGLPLAGAGPEEGPSGEHERTPLENPSVHVTPWFDPRNMESRKLTGHELLHRYHLGKEWVDRLSPHGDDRIAILPMIFLEGCNAHCAFCGYSTSTMVKRSIDDTIKAIASLRERHGIRYFHFLNTNINGYLKYADAFCDALIEADLDILWSDCANLWALTPQLLEKMVKSGCIRLTFGLECPSERMLKYIKKGITVEQAHDRLKLAHELGIWNHLLLITGLPTETEEDVQHFIDFLERAKDYSHGYSISSFYLISTSLMGAFPERFGLELLPNPSGLLEDQAFNEIGGLSWEEKKKQIVHSTEVVTNTIRQLKVDPKYWSGAIDLELIFWLYDRLGHDNKADIVRAYEEAWLLEPAHPKAYRGAIEDLFRDPPRGLRGPLEHCGLRARPAAMEVRGDALVLPFDAGSNRLELELRCGGQSSGGKLCDGDNLRVSAELRPPYADRLEELIAEGSELDRSMRKAGWSIETRNPSAEIGGVAFRIRRDDLVLDLSFPPVSPDSRVFLRRGGVGMVYSVPHGSPDRTGEPKVQRIMKAVGDFVLDRLAQDASSQSSTPVSVDDFRNVAQAMVDELEARLETPALRSAKGKGRRHGDKFSRVIA